MSQLPKPKNPPKRIAGARVPQYDLKDTERVDWMAEGEDTGTSNLYLVWQCMQSHQPGDIREVIDYLRKNKKRDKK